MGSFRIVTGSGYRRKEITGQEAAALFDALAESGNKDFALKNYRSRIIVTTSAPDKRKVENAVKRKYNKLFDEYADKYHDWAEETVAEIKSLLDYLDITDTGNLRDSISIVKETYDKNSGKIEVVVGVNKKRGPGGIKSPPFWMKSPKYGHKKGEHEGEREMPDKDYSPYVIGSRAKHAGLFELATGELGGTVNYNTRQGSPAATRIKQIAMRNAKKIIKGKL